MKIEGKQRLWNEYQKDIADNHYYYARSCIRQNYFPGSENAFLRILRDYLHKDVCDDPHQTTCTGIAYHSALIPFETTQAVVARQFSLMNQSNYKNFIPSCVTSFGVYSEVIETWNHFPETLEQARKHLYEAIGRVFSCPENIVHTSDIIYKFRMEIARLSKYKLIHHITGKPLKVVEHIGCHYAKMFPKKGVGGAEFPAVLSGMIEAWGGEVIDYPERRHCCGFGFRNYIIKENRGYCISNSKIKFDSMEPYKPDFIVTNCPGCTYFLDRWQYVIAETTCKTYGADGFGIPVLTYEEMAGLVLGMDPWDLGMQLHQVSVESLLDKMNIQYNPTKKHSGYMDENIGIPEKPEFLKIQV
jgi:heterodisulfide reductase subunit B